MDNSANMYQLYKKLLLEYFTGEVEPRMRVAQGENFLIQLVHQWNQYTIFAMLLNRAFSYVDRNYLRGNHMDTLGKFCQSEFKNRVIIGLEEQLQGAIIDQLTRDRNEEHINRDALKTAIQVYVDLGREGEQKPMRSGNDFYWDGTPNLAYYEQQFEAKYLELTRLTFRQKANQWNSDCDCFSYLNEVDKAFVREEYNADFWLQAQTKPKMLEIVIKELVTDKAHAVVEKSPSGVLDFLKQQELSKLQLLFNIFKRNPTTYEQIIDKMRPYIIDRGTSIVMNDENLKSPLDFTQKLLDFKREVDIMVEQSFYNQIDFQKARDNSFMEFMNEQMSTPTFMAQYTDNMMQKTLKGKDDA